MTKPPFVTASLAGIALILTGCNASSASVADGNNLPPAGAHLADVTYPPDFMFQLTRPLDVHVHIPATASGTDGRAPVEIRRPDQVVVFRGSVAAGRDLDLRLPVTKELGSLVFITTDGAGIRHMQTVAIDPNNSALDVQLVGG